MATNSPDIRTDEARDVKQDPSLNSDAIPEASHADDSSLAAIDEKALMRKIDRRLIPWLSLLYLLSFLGA